MDQRLETVRSRLGMPRRGIFRRRNARMGIAARGLERGETADVMVRLGITKRSPSTKSSNQRWSGTMRCSAGSNRSWRISLDGGDG